MKKKISIIGGGTSALFCAAFLDSKKYNITIYEKQKSLGRKFLVAGDGGFNLTHSEAIDRMISRYSPSNFLSSSLLNFTNEDFRMWLDTIGIPTFIGSSKRVFPEKGIKPITVLKKIVYQLEQNKVNIKYGYVFTGWDKNNTIIFNGKEIIDSDINVFALGGGSWKVTGSDGKWLEIFKNKNIDIQPFRASNCAFQIAWKKEFIEKFEGVPFKNIAITIDGQRQKGEIVITKFGIEGNAIYALSPIIQNKLEEDKLATVFLDFKPTLSLTNVLEKVNNSKYNITETLKKVLKLTSPQIFLIKNGLTKEEYLNSEFLVKSIKNFPLNIINSAPIDEAISTGGGLKLKSLNSKFELIDLKNNYCIGEMINWDAPTGGYLIQACASMGIYVANILNKY